MKNPDIVGVNSSGVIELSIAIDSPAWFEWLKGQRSFSYRKGTKGGFTCSRRGNNKWYAVKKIHATNGGKTVPLYIGDDSECTQEKLEYCHQHFGMESADFWNWYYSSERSRRPRKGCTSSECATNGDTLVPGSEEVARLKAEVERLKAELEAANQTVKNQETLLRLTQEESILAQKDAIESKALVDAYKEQWDAEVNELVSRIEPLTRDQAQHQVTKLKLNQAESRAEKLQSVVAEYQAKLEASSAIAQLNRYLDEVGGIPLDEKGKPKARYDQLAKFKQWLGY